ncbi:MAG: Gfo/Idh/MocA family oxidoreductase [Actinobacteria bacterium]|nr:Gfo/Idh/MocA family oxidoreductase [Actinomycetota bacterium]
MKNVPRPLCKPGGVLVRNVRSVISAGTERGIIELGRKSLIGKAKARPDLVRRALAKARREGFLKTFKEAMGRLDEPTALGYSSAGIIEEVGSGVSDLSLGDRVACIGAGFASHAEFVWVPRNLCALIPKDVNFDSAAFGMLGIIALHGLRCAKPELGWRVGVIGLGLLGQITVQLLAASGSSVLAIDLSPERVALAKTLGAAAGAAVGSDDVPSVARGFSHGRGLDAVIITAAAKDRRPLDLAAQIAAANSRVVLVGVCSIEIDRKAFWEKEIQFVVSRAGGPGTFDPSFELAGLDYPRDYVRWTQRSNLQEFLHLLETRKVTIEPLIGSRCAIADALTAYESIGTGSNGSIGTLLEYSEQPSPSESVDLQPSRKPAQGQISLGVIGAGIFAKALLLPELSRISRTKNVSLRGLATTTGSTAEHLGQKFGFKYCTSDYTRLFKDDDIQAVFILTRHNLHQSFICQALQAGKDVFVEKPLCLTEEQLRQIYDAYFTAGSRQPVLMVGHNRRFGKLVIQAREFFANRQTPLMLNLRVNAGLVPPDHWVHDPDVGGGRLLSEGCHYIDLAAYLADSEPVRVYAQQISRCPGSPPAQNVSVILNLADGSVAQILYTASGHQTFSRERIEMFADGSVFAIDDFRLAWYHRGSKRRKIKLLNQDMGYTGELSAFLSDLRADSPSTDFPGYAASTLATIRANESLRTGTPLDCRFSEFIA